MASSAPSPMQEKLTSAIDYSLQNCLYSNALFLAERLHLEADSEASATRLATVHVRMGKYNRAIAVLKGRALLANRRLLAQCHLSLGSFTEALDALQDDPAAHNDAAALYILGDIHRKKGQTAKAVQSYRRALSLNPTLWTAYTALCELGISTASSAAPHSDAPLPPATASSFHLSRRTDAQTPALLLSTPSVHAVAHTTGGAFATPANATTISTPAPHLTATGAPTPGVQTPMISYGAAVVRTPEAGGNSLAPPASAGPMVGLTPPAGSPSIPHEPHKAPKKVDPRARGDRKAKPPASSAAARSLFTPSSAATRTTATPAWRGGGAMDVDEPSAPSSLVPATVEKPTTAASRKSVPAGNTAKTPAAASVQNVEPPQTGTSGDRGMNALLQLLAQLGRGYQLLCMCDSVGAIQALEELPPVHRNSAWVNCQLAKAYFQMAGWSNAKALFEEAARLDPTRAEDMELFSTVLWHLRNETQLSYLAHHLAEVDPLAPQTWCALGNCFSLQKERDTAIKFFMRALQVDPSFTYAWTLSGHEYVATNDAEKALVCFRHAIRLDERHYNAWCGLGLIYRTQGRHDLAEYHFRRALGVNSHSSILHCYYGMTLMAKKRHGDALARFDQAITLDPKNTLAVFHRASTLYAMERYDEALVALQQLSEVAPKEAPIYFLMGKIYKRLKQLEAAVLHFTVAMDLDQKNSNHIKAIIDKINQPDAGEDVELT